MDSDIPTHIKKRIQKKAEKYAAAILKVLPDEPKYTLIAAFRSGAYYQFRELKEKIKLWAKL